jgi:hypothetical protein
VTEPGAAEPAPHDIAHDAYAANLPRRAAVLGVLLLALGFVVGYGFHTVQSEQRPVAPMEPDQTANRRAERVAQRRKARRQS